MAESELQHLRDRLLRAFARGEDMDAAAFEALALDVFRAQFEHNPVYRAYCTRRDRMPGTVRGWLDVPAVPTAAFREVRLLTPLAEREPDAVFRTSGTTRGRERRGEHVVPDLSLYRASLLPTFDHFVLPDGARPTLLSLVPSPPEQPDSSLSFMIGEVVRQRGNGESGWFVSVADGLDAARLLAALRLAEASDAPVALLGTTLAFDRLLEAMEADDVRVRLPERSRLMDTGGPKGAGREVSPATMSQRYADRLGIAPDWQVNEYGMTELCSQFYDGRIRAATGAEPQGAARLRKAGPPWLRSTAVDPATLEPLPTGEPGILRHHDLANLGSVAAVQTEDLGRVHEDGTIELLGRLPGAQPRGCSIALDLMLGRG